MLTVRAVLALCLLLGPLALAAEDAPAAPPAEACPEGSVSERVHALLLRGNRAGFQTTCLLPDGSRRVTFAFNDRGRGPSLRSTIRLDEVGLPRSIETDGRDYYANPIAERFAVAEGTARWKNKVEEGSRKLAAPAFYFSQSGTPEEVALLKEKGVTVDPTQRIGDLRRVRLVVKDGAILDPDALCREVGIGPVEGGSR